MVTCSLYLNPWTVVTRVSQTAPKWPMMITHLVLFSRVTKVKFALVGCSPLLADYGIRDSSSPRTDHICICLAEGKDHCRMNEGLNFLFLSLKPYRTVTSMFAPLLFLVLKKKKVMSYQTICPRMIYEMQSQHISTIWVVSMWNKLYLIILTLNF